MTGCAISSTSSLTRTRVKGLSVGVGSGCQGLARCAITSSSTRVKGQLGGGGGWEDWILQDMLLMERFLMLILIKGLMELLLPISLKLLRTLLKLGPMELRHSLLRLLLLLRLIV